MKTTNLLSLPFLFFTFLTMTGYSQEHYIDSKKDTSFSFTLTSKCIDVMNYDEDFEGVFSRFIADNSQILELRIVKNCGQTTTLNVASLTDSIVIKRTDTGDMTTCECYQVCTLTVDNVDRVAAFNMFNKNEYLLNPYYNAIADNELATDFDVLYFNNMITIIGDVQESLDVRLINQIGQEVFYKKTNGSTIELPPDLIGLYICVIKTSNNFFSKKIYISPH